MSSDEHDPPSRGSSDHKSAPPVRPAEVPATAAAEEVSGLGQQIAKLLLAQPLGALLPPAQLAAQLTRTLRAADLEQLEKQLTQALEEAIARLEDQLSTESGASLASTIPVSLETPLAQLAQAAQTPTLETLQAIADHPAMREVLRAVLLDTVSRFASAASGLLAEAGRVPGAGRLSGTGPLAGVLGVAKGLGGALVEELGRVLRGKAGPFVDQALAGAFRVGLQLLADPEREAIMSDWRIDASKALLDLPARHWRAELKRAKVPLLVQAVVGLLQAFANYADTEALLARQLQLAGVELWAQPMGELLQDYGLAPALLEREVGETLEHLLTLIRSNSDLQLVE